MKTFWELYNCFNNETGFCPLIKKKNEIYIITIFNLFLKQIPKDE